MLVAYKDNLGVIMNHKLLTGTLDLMVLEILSEQASYGYEISQTVLSRSQEVFELKEGSLYPALHRLERNGELASFWEQADGRRRKYYRITAAGKKALSAKRDEWKSFSRAVNGVLGPDTKTVEGTST